jgi:hypothetical protein
MLKFITSLGFLYMVCIVIMIGYGVIYYRNFQRGRYQRSLFPLVIIMIGGACLSFLWVNFHPSLRLKTFGNLDHHFLQHDGFEVSSGIELGKTDTANYDNLNFNRFLFSKKQGKVFVNALYSEEPMYKRDGDTYRILSQQFPAVNHVITYEKKSVKFVIRVADNQRVALHIGDSVFTRQIDIKRGISCWNIFRQDDGLINSVFFHDPVFLDALKAILLIRDNVNRKSGEALTFFLSGSIISQGAVVRVDEREIHARDLAFEAILQDGDDIAWGIGFLENNRNQYKVKYSTQDKFIIAPRYPVSYPLAMENREEWTAQRVNKFLVADQVDLQKMPAVFREGYLFPFFETEHQADFAPVLLSYEKGAYDQPLGLQVSSMDAKRLSFGNDTNSFALPSRSGNFNWLFSVRDTYQWNFSSMKIKQDRWSLMIFGSLGLFIILVSLQAIFGPAIEQRWVWQLLSGITLILLTTRFFLYWRYKTFPPYEGMDLPSQQQLYSWSNFIIIVGATITLAIAFGLPLVKQVYQFFTSRLLKGNSTQRRENSHAGFLSAFTRPDRLNSKAAFFISWGLFLLSSGGIVAFHNFDHSTSRHAAVILLIGYFIFLHWSYRNSPLVKPTHESWWRVGTGNLFDMLVNNPVKLLLSASLLALFVFIDIGFAIVFLNFLIFHEAFLCLNYSIAGLSAGSSRNARIFGVAGAFYFFVFVLNLVFAPYVFKFILEMPEFLYSVMYCIAGVTVAYVITRLSANMGGVRRRWLGVAITLAVFAGAFLFFPKQRVLDKASMTKYRIDVLTTPVDQAIIGAYKEGKTYEPVIRAAQNQWFINTFIDSDNNPGVSRTGFQLLPHAPQNKGAKYNAQATDLVASRFLLAEHGTSSVLLYVVLLLLPVVMIGSFYKLYPDFTNRGNTNYPLVTAAFSVINYLLVTALLVVLAATGRYIFFGQDLPFASILSKQSILFPAIMILSLLLLFKRIPQEYYANRYKLVPGMIIFLLLGGLLFFTRPVYNKSKSFTVGNLAKEMDDYVQVNLQPVFDYIDTATRTRRLPIARKDQLFTDSLKKILHANPSVDEHSFFRNELKSYARSGFSRHLDQRQMLYLDINSGSPQLAVNENFFRVDPPPHLQEMWKGNVYGDTTIYNATLWNANDGGLISFRLNPFDENGDVQADKHFKLSFGGTSSLMLINTSQQPIVIDDGVHPVTLQPNESYPTGNPGRIRISDAMRLSEQVLTIEPDAFMKNYHVNGSRFYAYPMGPEFIWARNFAEAISADYAAAGDLHRNAFVSLDYALMDSLSKMIETIMRKDTSYKKGAEYAVCIADNSGRILAMTDYIKGFKRPDPNDKAAFNKVLLGENGYVSQSLLRKQVGNLNLLRLNPGPGSTFKPIVFSAIASQLDWNWDDFSAEGFSEKQTYYGGERVPEYDFEKDNGIIRTVSDYLRYSDNYYHSNVLLLGSYPKQEPAKLLANHFMKMKPGTGLQWPYFTYTGKQYWLSGFQNWPGFKKGQADFGMDSSFTSIGLLNNFGIATHETGKGFEKFGSSYDSLLFLDGYRKSGFILPESGLFDQRGDHVNHRVPYDLFISCFRGHVKGSSQVMVPPVKMVDALGKIISQNRNYSLTLNPYAAEPVFSAFDVDKSIPYSRYLEIMREKVFTGMREALFRGTAARLGTMLKNGAPYFYYAKTGTTGDDQSKSKSKLLAFIISEKDITHPDFNFRKNKFYTIYFTSQDGPAKQNEEFQASVIRMLENSYVFSRDMRTGKK